MDMGDYMYVAVKKKMEFVGCSQKPERPRAMMAHFGNVVTF